MGDALLADLLALAEEWRAFSPSHPEALQMLDDWADLIAKHTPKPKKCAECGHAHTPMGCTGDPTPSDLWAGVTPAACDCEPDASERDELARVLHQGTCEGRLFAHNASVTRCERAANAILAAGWRKR